MRERSPGMGIEVLIPDFDGSDDRLRTVMDARPDILNHNLETVKRLQKPVRKRARWDRSLYVLRRAKAPFQPPLAAWLKSDLREMVSDTLSADAVARLGLLDVTRVEALKREHFAGVANHAFKLWNLLNFVEWHRLFVHGAWTAGASDTPARRPPRDGLAATEVR